MFCPNCGEKILSHDIFCPNCGHEIIKNATEPTAKSKRFFKREDVEEFGSELPELKLPQNQPTNKLNEKWWFRLIQVFYVLIYVIAILVIIAVGYASKGGGGFDSEKSMIHCNNGQSYNPQKNNIFLFSSYLSTSDDQNIRILCQYDTLNFYSHTAPTYKNYTFEAVTQPVSWTTSWNIWFWGLIILIIFMEIIKRIFYYIVIGKSFFDFKK